MFIFGLGLGLGFDTEPPGNPPITGDSLLLENGDSILLETGIDSLLLE